MVLILGENESFQDIVRLLEQMMTLHKNKLKEQHSDML